MDERPDTAGDAGDPAGSSPDPATVGEATPDRAAAPPPSVTPDAAPAAVYRPWGALPAVLVAWLLPSTAARRTARLPLWRAFAVHIVPVILAVLTVISLFAFSEWLDRDEPFHQLVFEVFDDISDMAIMNPIQFIVVLIVIVLSIEIGLLVLGLITTPWGAADERLRASLANGLRQTWLHTFHAVPVILLMGLLIIAYDRAWDAHHLRGDSGPSYPDLPYPERPSFPDQTDPDSEAWQSYQQALEEHEAQMQEFQQQMQAYHEQVQMHWREQRRRQPLWIRFGPAFLVGCGLACCAWILWSLFRGAGTARPVTPIARPPTCEDCGYNLTTMPMEARCPECGVPVVESLGPDNRPGPAWLHRHNLGLWPPYVKTVFPAVFRPRAFGRSFRATAFETDYRGLMGFHLAVAFVVTMAGIMAAFWLQWRHDAWFDPVETLGILASIQAGFATLVVFTVTMLSALAVGAWYRLTLKRNLAGVAGRIACCQSLYLVIWAMLMAINFVAASWLAQHGFFEALRDMIFLDEEFLVFLSIVLPFLLLALVCLRLNILATTATRYANR